jgi:CBS domain containing-hemolysin-like protein
MIDNFPVIFGYVSSWENMRGVTDPMTTLLKQRVSGHKRALAVPQLTIHPRIIPQAVCAKYGLSIGAQCTPFVLILMYLFRTSPLLCPFIFTLTVSSPHRMANRQAVGLGARRARRAYIQKGRTQIFPPIPSFRTRTPQR